MLSIKQAHNRPSNLASARLSFNSGLDALAQSVGNAMHVIGNAMMAAIGAEARATVCVHIHATAENRWAPTPTFGNKYSRSQRWRHAP